jgi:hypothetical protein
MRLILALAEVLNCQLEKDLSIGQRLSARPSGQPYICCGMADPTDWKMWPFADAPIDLGKLSTSAQFAPALQFGAIPPFMPFVIPVGLTALVDTSGCGFLTTPCYTARIDGPRRKSLTHELKFATAETQTITLKGIVDALVQIVQPSPQEFTVEVLLLTQLIEPLELRSLTRTPQDVNDELKRLREEFLKLFTDWRVVWMGVEG